MKKVLVVEGVADKKFLEDYLLYLKLNQSNIIVDIKVIGTNRIVDTEKVQNATNIKKLYNKENEIYIIFDADNSIQNTLDTIMKDITNECKINDYNKDNIFLFPNNRDVGKLETILETIAIHKNVLACFDKYKECINSINEPSTNEPDIKSKIFAYIESIETNKDKLKEKDRDYLNADYFDLAHNYLNELKNYLTRIITE